jgi:hypothetical protein
MVVNEQPIEGYYSGDTRRLLVDVVDEDDNAVDISGADIEYVIADRDDNIVITKDLQDGIAVTDAANGQFRIDIEPSDTADLQGDHLHECEITDQNGEVTTVFTGGVEILEDLIE